MNKLSDEEKEAEIERLLALSQSINDKIEKLYFERCKIMTKMQELQGVFFND